MRLLLPILACALLGNGAAQSQQFQEPQKVEAESVQSRKADSKLIGVTSSNPSADERSGHDREEGTEFLGPFFGYKFKVTDGLLVFFTSILTAFTGLLWRSTHKMWTSTEKSIALARDEFISTHRPKLVVRRVSINIAKGTGIPDVLGVQYLIYNIGDTPAKIVEISAKLWPPESADNLPAIPPYGDSEYPGITLASGESCPFVHYTTAEVTNEYFFRLGYERTTDTRAYVDTQPTMLFLGYVDYEDGLNRVRRTAFLRAYNFDTQRFEPISHPDYEYQA